MKQLKWLLWLVLGIFLFFTLHILLPPLAPAQTPLNNPRFQTLLQADRLYLQGETAAAEQLYRQVKPSFSTNHPLATVQPITDPAQLDPASQVYWRTAQEGIQQGLESKIFTPLQQLIEQQPEFIPAYSLYYQQLQADDRPEEAISILEKGVALFPDSVDLTQALIAALEADDQFLEASVTARQFAIVYPDHPQATEFTQLAEDNLDRFRNGLTERNVVQGVLGSVIGVFTGDRGGRAIENASLLLQGESGFGSRYAAAYSQELPVVRDPQITDYVNNIGQSIAELMGRDFDYEFYVVQDDSWNAFALPGGKIFLFSGMMLGTNSEAEFAGVMAHEIAHAVLSHSYQQMTRSNLLSNLGSVLPFGDLVSSLLSLSYSRQHEQQADLIGTRALSVAGYASDGLYNAFVGLKQQEGAKPPEYLSTHPLTDNRIQYIEALIQRNGYNPYAFEGVERHAQMKERLRQIISGDSVTVAIAPIQSSAFQSSPTSVPSNQTTSSMPSTPSPQTDHSVPSPEQLAATTATPTREPVPSPTTPSPTTPITNRPSAGEVALAASQELNDVLIRFDGGQVNTSGSYTVKVIIENNSDRMFAFVPVFVKVEDANGQDVAARFTFEDADHTTAEPGETLQGQLSILGQQWQSSGTQGLTLVIREGTTGGRVFRIPIQ